MIKGVYAHFVNLVPDSNKGIEKLEELFKVLSTYDFNFILPLAKDTRSRASYGSKLIEGKIYKNIDLLKETSRLGREYSIKVYPWVCVYSEGGAELGPILKRHADWAFKSIEGKVRGYICPSNTEARNYMIDVIREIIDNYEVDGISLDYVRTPGGLCYCENCRKKFAEEYGVDPLEIKYPSDLWYKWEEFHCENITAFVKQAGKLVRSRGLKLSAYVWTSTSRYVVAQDWPKWVRSGLLDFVIPTGYVYSLDLFKRLCIDALTIAKNIPAYICIGIKTSHGFLERPEDVVDYMRVAERVGLKGYVFFRLESLLPMINKLFGK